MNARALVFLLLGALLMGGLFVLLKPDSPPDAAPATTATVPAAAAERRFEFVIQNGVKTYGPEVMPVMQGDTVTLMLAADRADELHVHGYDLEEKIVPKQATVLTFKADRSGRFTIELHHGHLELGALEVQPR